MDDDTYSDGIYNGIDFNISVENRPYAQVTLTKPPSYATAVQKRVQLNKGRN